MTSCCSDGGFANTVRYDQHGNPDSSPRPAMANGAVLTSLEISIIYQRDREDCRRRQTSCTSQWMGIGAQRRIVWAIDRLRLRIPTTY